MRGGRGRCEGRDLLWVRRGLARGTLRGTGRAEREETPAVAVRGSVRDRGSWEGRLGASLAAGACWCAWSAVGALEWSAASFSQLQPEAKLIASAQHSEVTATSPGAEPETKY